MRVIEAKEKIEKINSETNREEIVLICLEELSELQKAITKAERKCYELCGDFGDTIKNVIEEMADVYIIIEHLKIMYGITDNQLQKQIERKINRTLKRLENE